MKPKYIALIVITIIVLGGAIAVIVTMNQPTTPSTNQNASSPSGTSTNQASGEAVVIQNFAFSPSTLTVKKGTVVTWTNKDSVAHTVTGDDVSASGLDSSLLSSGDTFQHTFDKVGSFSYHCTPHPRMTATIVVTE